MVWWTAVLASIAAVDTLYSRTFWVLGPFPAALRETWGVPPGLPDPGHIEAPETTRVFPSPVVRGGTVRWRRLTVDTPAVEIPYEATLLDSLVPEQYGYAGSLIRTVVWTLVEAPRTGVYWMEAQHTGTVWINGTPYASDPYEYGVRVPVLLKAGRNRVVFTVRGFGTHRFSLRFIPTEKVLAFMDNDVTFPDLTGPGVYALGVPVVNLSNRWRTPRVEVQVDGHGASREVRLPPLVPLGVYKAPLSVDLRDSPGPGETLWVVVRLWEGDTLRDERRLPLRRPEPGAVYRVTFRSRVDGSVQYYAVRPPEGGSPPYALILALHGAGVEAVNMARAYAPRDDAYVISPTNRRPFGFDWEDWGRIDAMEVLEDAIHRFPVDTLRLHLTGHSMGGHGVWHLATLYGWRFASVVPSGSWESLERYIPPVLREGDARGNPAVLAVRDRVRAQAQPLRLMVNLHRTPVLVVHGGRDEVVPPYQARWMFATLSRWNPEAVYWEVPGKKHWWDMPGEGAACVDHPRIRRFFQTHTREVPDTVVWVTYHIGIAGRSHWVRVLQARTPGERVYVRAWRHRDTVVVEVANVAALALDAMRGIRWVEIRDGGRRFRLRRDPRGDTAVLSVEGGTWRWGYTPKPEEKRPGWYGPMKEALFRPFTLVYPTHTDARTREAYRDVARWLQWVWYIRGNGITVVLPDTLALRSPWREKNLVLLGTEENHRLLREYGRRLPFRLEGDTLFTPVGAYPHAWARFVYPSPLTERALWLVQLGPPEAGLTFPLFRSGMGLPDYMVFTRAVWEAGWDGVLEAGFFDRFWRYPAP